MERCLWKHTVAGALLVLAPSTVTAHGEAVQAIHTLPRIAAPVIDGVLGDEEWRGALVLSLDHQTEPGDNTAPSERTEVWLGYDAGHLYVAIRAWDSDPTAIRARVARRDDIAGDDRVTLHLDTFNDRRRAYVFAFNPLGIQADGLYTEGTTIGRNWEGNVDSTWDGVLASQGRIVEDGWTVEAAIPFRTLRYAAGADRHWGLHVQRWIVRKAENVSWRPLSRQASSLLTQMGTVGGLGAIRAARPLDLIPTLTSAVERTPSAPGRMAQRTDWAPGLTANWGVTPNLALGATLNPDFSQIEADVPQIEVNQRFPLFYAEKRPFFYEGGQFFQSPGAMNFVNTRQIVDPDWGTKLTGKAGANTVAVLAAADAAPGRRAGPDGPGEGDAAHFGVLRYQRDLFGSSTMGGFVTERRFAGASNTVVAADGQLRFPLNTIGFQFARSSTTELDETRAGTASYIWYDFVGRNWRLFVNDLRLSDGYDSRVGFVRRRGFRAHSMTFGYEFQGNESRWFVRARPFVVARYLKTTEGLVDESYVDPGVDLRLVRDVSVYAYTSFRQDAFAGQGFPHRFLSVNTTVNTWKRVTVGHRVQVGEAVHFDPFRPQVGRHLSTALTATFKPDERLNSEWLYLKSRLQERDTGRELFDQDVVRTRTSFQFTRDHASRVIAEYNTLTRRASLSVLYSYTPRPNTTVYAGYGDVYLNGIDAFDATPRDGLHALRRTVFLKLSVDWKAR